MFNESTLIFIKINFNYSFYQRKIASSELDQHRKWRFFKYVDPFIFWRFTN